MNSGNKKAPIFVDLSDLKRRKRDGEHAQVPAADGGPWQEDFVPCGESLTAEFRQS